MTLGFVMMCHDEPERAIGLARHWAEQGAPVVIHVDARAPQSYLERLEQALADLPIVSFCERFSSEWGSWSLVAAAQTGAAALLERHAEVERVFLASGACLPLRPLAEMQTYLDAFPDADFIESVITSEVDWAKGGLERERFTLYFPFSWRRHRQLFDRFVNLQRRIGIRRHIPQGIEPHLGSQWWCLTRKTLEGILNDPRRAEYERYFRSVWIPDESFFQTLARHHARRIESRSLTINKFDRDGKPHVFYDDHHELLRRSECFVVRKVWPQADRLYRSFLDQSRPARAHIVPPDPSRIDRIFAQAAERRQKGRPGLYMQSRFPNRHHEGSPTAYPYAVFQGYSDLFEGFESWLTRRQVGRVHGHLYAHDQVEYGGRVQIAPGSMTDNPALRNYDQRGFLTNLIWNNRGERQCFQISPRDRIHSDLYWFMSTDPNAIMQVVTGAWAVPLFHSGKPVQSLWREAARLQRRELEQITILNSIWTRARINLVNLSEFQTQPTEHLQRIVDLLHPRADEALSETPQMVDLTGFGRFLRALRNQGMRPLVMGEFDERDTWPRQDEED